MRGAWGLGGHGTPVERRARVPGSAPKLPPDLIEGSWFLRHSPGMSDGAAKAVRGGPRDAGAPPVNLAVAKRFEETAALLQVQEANPFRVRAYRQAAATLRGLGRPVDEIVRSEGTPGLDRLPVAF